MKTRKLYLALTIADNGKYYSYTLPVSPSDNLLSRLRIPNIVAATPCGSRKEAMQTVSAWNETYQKNGCFLYA